MQYYIRIDNRNVYVSEEIYKLYCKGERKERYFRESDIHIRHSLIMHWIQKI